MASIRNLGDCPCPRCKIKLSKVHNFGMPMDRIQRRTQARTDDSARREKVEKAQGLIYQGGHIINSAEIERQLKSESLVPTGVSVMLLYKPPSIHYLFRMHFRSGCHLLVLICFQCLLLTYYMNLRLACGDHCSYTSFEYWIAEMVSFIQWIDGEIWIHHVCLCRLLTSNRYRAVPTFGRDTIRKFSNNCSGLKQMAARDFEDILQVFVCLFYWEVNQLKETVCNSSL